MIFAIRHASGLGNMGLYGRVRAGSGQWWNFVSSEWCYGVPDPVSGAAYLAETPDGDPATSLYSAEVNLVPVVLALNGNHEFVVEIVLAATGQVLRSEVPAPSAQGVRDALAALGSTSGLPSDTGSLDRLIRLLGEQMVFIPRHGYHRLAPVSGFPLEAGATIEMFASDSIFADDWSYKQGELDENGVWIDGPDQGAVSRKALGLYLRKTTAALTSSVVVALETSADGLVWHRHREVDLLGWGDPIGQRYGYFGLAGGWLYMYAGDIYGNWPASATRRTVDLNPDQSHVTIGQVATRPPADYPTAVVYRSTAPVGKIHAVGWASGVTWVYRYDALGNFDGVVES